MATVNDNQLWMNDNAVNGSIVDQSAWNQNMQVLKTAINDNQTQLTNLGNGTSPISVKQVTTPTVKTDQQGTTGVLAYLSVSGTNNNYYGLQLLSTDAAGSTVSLKNLTASTGREWQLVSNTDGTFTIVDNGGGGTRLTIGTDGTVTVANNLTVNALVQTNTLNVTSGASMQSTLSVNGVTTFNNDANLAPQGVATSGAPWPSWHLGLKRSYWSGSAAVTGTSLLFVDSAGSIYFDNENSQPLMQLSQNQAVTFYGTMGVPAINVTNTLTVASQNVMTEGDKNKRLYSSVYRNAAYTTPANTAFFMQWDSAKQDNLGTHTLISGVDKFTVSKAGVFTLTGNVYFAASTTWTIRVYVNGILTKRVSGGTGQNATFAATLALNANDYVQLELTTTTSVNYGGGSPVDSWVELIQIA